jgi:hypothetical protein
VLVEVNGLAAGERVFVIQLDPYDLVKPGRIRLAEGRTTWFKADLLVLADPPALQDVCTGSSCPECVSAMYRRELIEQNLKASMDAA